MVKYGQNIRLPEIRFYDMKNIHIPCYAQYLSFHIKVNDETVAETLKVSLLDISSSLDAILVIGLFHFAQNWNGWILITSNNNQCFRLFQ